MALLDGKICVITGATSGIGYATAAKLVPMGARLVLVARSRERGEAAAAKLAALEPGAEISVVYADLARLPDVRQLARELASLPRIDMLVNNAGAIFRQRHETPEGLERTFALNHMAYYLLTRLLLPQLAAAAPARIVNVASRAHQTATLDFDDLQMARRYSGWTAYRRSKLCNILFTRELSRRLAGKGITANALHPGFVASRFGDNTDGLFRMALALGKQLFAITSEHGAETPVYVAASPDVAGVSGLYFHRSKPILPSAAAQDNAAGLRLWQVSAEIAGLSEDRL
jgi:NAD(P)-dependent dehydrogenase (short-subunit alcohol dehydrogenase family)